MKMLEDLKVLETSENVGKKTKHILENMKPVGTHENALKTCKSREHPTMLEKIKMFGTQLNMLGQPKHVGKHLGTLGNRLNMFGKVETCWVSSTGPYLGRKVWGGPKLSRSFRRKQKHMVE